MRFIRNRSNIYWRNTRIWARLMRLTGRSLAESRLTSRMQEDTLSSSLFSSCTCWTIWRQIQDGDYTQCWCCNILLSDTMVTQWHQDNVAVIFLKQCCYCYHTEKRRSYFTQLKNMLSYKNSCCSSTIQKQCCCWYITKTQQYWSNVAFLQIHCS